MNQKFWMQKWKRNEIAFHKNEAHPLLTRFFGSLALKPGSRVFIPLCGKTRDISWLLSQGLRVAGAELSKIAIEQLFAELQLSPTVTDFGSIQRHSAKDIDIYVGNFFDLPKDLLGRVDAVYDRAALVALPEQMRQRYAVHLTQITQAASQLVVSYDYDQSLAVGPPFCVSGAEIRNLYGGAYGLTHLARVDAPGGIRGLCPAAETVYLLNSKQGSL